MEHRSEKKAHAKKTSQALGHFFAAHFFKKAGHILKKAARFFKKAGCFFSKTTCSAPTAFHFSFFLFPSRCRECSVFVLARA